MFVSDWMTRKVFSVAPDDSVTDAIALQRERKIKHLPVVKEGRLKGIISDRDIKDFSPSSATTLDVYELHYLLARTRVKEVMRTKVHVTSPDMPIEEAAKIMYDHKVHCLPVMEEGRLAGIISDHDLFRALVDITGVRHGGHRIFMTVPDRPGSVRDVADVVRKHGFRLQSVLTSYEGAKEGSRFIVIRTKGKGQFGAMKAELQGAYRDVRIRKG